MRVFVETDPKTVKVQLVSRLRAVPDRLVLLIEIVEEGRSELALAVLWFKS